jgi:hypothetical protein
MAFVFGIIGVPGWLIRLHISHAAILLTATMTLAVDPAKSRKMTGALQSLRSSLSERIAQFTDAFSFLFDQPGIN